MDWTTKMRKFLLNQVLTVLTALEASHADRRLLEQLHALAFLIIQLTARRVAIFFIVITITDNAVSNQVVANRVYLSCLLQVGFRSLLLCPFVADLLNKHLRRLFVALVRFVIDLFAVGPRRIACFIL